MERILYPTLPSIAVRTAYALAFAYLSYLAKVRAEAPIFTSIATAFAVGYAVFTVLKLIPGVEYLKLTDAGFERKTYFLKRFVAWKDVEYFKVYRNRGWRYVGWTYTPTADRNALFNRIGESFMGIHDGLTQNFGLTAAELSYELESWRKRREGTR
jgi:hypothetical protein